LPFPASATPANTRTPRTSTNVPVSRMVNLPFPASHVRAGGAGWA
jgi:hypothetical protein